MPIKIPNELPATNVLTAENIFVMTETRAITQDIRPLQILLLNLMPTKVDTETQLARVLGNTPLQIELELIAPSGHVSKNTSQAHMLAFYKMCIRDSHKTKKQTSENSRYHTGHQQLGDGLASGDTIKDHHQAGRDHWSQCAANSLHSCGEILGIASLFHLRIHEAANGCRCCRSGAGEGRKAGEGESPCNGHSDQHESQEADQQNNRS